MNNETDDIEAKMGTGDIIFSFFVCLVVWFTDLYDVVDVSGLAI